MTWTCYPAGKFEFYFWDFGIWKKIEVDDLLPTVNDKLIYAQETTLFTSSKGNRSEFWAPLVEKAFAK
jgi:hypothetical protein